MTFKTMKWIRSVRDKNWEETKDVSPEERQRYFEAKRKETEDRISQIQKEKHKAKG